MTRRLLALLVAASAACTEVGSDPDAPVALQFEGSAYPSIVASDSLRDSLGLLQPLRATALNFEGEPIPDVPAVFSSPDTIVRVMSDGVVYARGPKADAAPVRVFATIGSLQSPPDSLFVVLRADSLAAVKATEAITVGPNGGTSGPDSLRFSVFGDSASGSPGPIAHWLVSYQLRYRGTLLSPTDTSVAYTFEATGGATPRRVPTFIDTTDAQGVSARRVFVRSIPAAATEDTIVLVATIRTRTVGAPPISAETMILLRRQ
jgi:hypothetical protein